MNTWQGLIVVLPLLGGARPGAQQEPVIEEPEVDFAVLADTTALVPGATFHLAAHFELPPDCHIYWENPGQSGMATAVEVKAPEGFEVGSPLYPGPKSLEIELEIVSYVYEGVVAVFVPITAPEELDPEAAYAFELSAEWLVCNSACFLQEGRGSIELAAHKGEGKPATANEEALASSFARLPEPQSACGELQYQWLASPPEYRARVVVRGATYVEFFPDLETNLVISRTTDNPGGNAYEMAVDFASTPGQEDDAPRATGVLLVVDRKQTSRYYEVSFAPEPSPAAPSSR